MKTLLLFFLVGVVVVSEIEACGRCETNHPQMHYCTSDFAVRVKILQSELDSSHELNVIRGRVIHNMKLSPNKKGKVIEFYSPSSICGTTFRNGGDYVITGTKSNWPEGGKYFLHSSCDFAKEWDDLSEHEQRGFTRKYARYCECKIAPTSSAMDIKVGDPNFVNTYPDASTYWTPDNCYYNPHKSRQYADVEDCEEEYGLCAPGRGGECGWQLTEEYEKCFRDRDRYVMVTSADFAITDPEQCNVLPKRKRKKCRKEARENAAQLGGEEIELPIFYK